MLGAIIGIWAARSYPLDTFQAVGITFPPNLSAMPSTAKTFVVTTFPVNPSTGFGIALTQNITSFPVNPSTGFGIAITQNITSFPVNPSTGFGIALTQNITSFPITLRTAVSTMLLHFDGSFIDSSVYAHTPSTTGTTTISTAQSVFGGSSAYFTGGVPLKFANSSDFSLSGATFTIEMRAYELTGSAGSLLSHRVAGGPAGWALTTSGLRANINNVFSDVQIVWARPSLNSWHHYAWVCLNGTMSMYVDGALVGTRTGVTSVYDATTSLCFGQADDNTENRFIGYIDEFRWSQRAEYTSNFTPVGPYTL
jgi:hypothetical protein